MFRETFGKVVNDVLDMGMQDGGRDHSVLKMRKVEKYLSSLTSGFSDVDDYKMHVFEFGEDSLMLDISIWRLTVLRRWSRRSRSLTLVIS